MKRAVALVGLAFGLAACADDLAALNALLGVDVQNLSGVERALFEGVEYPTRIAAAPGADQGKWCAELADPATGKKITSICSDGEITPGALPTGTPCAEVRLDFGDDGAQDASSEACIAEGGGLDVTDTAGFVVVVPNANPNIKPPHTTVNPRVTSHGETVTIRWRGSFADTSTLKFRLWQHRDKGFLYWESDELVVTGTQTGELELTIDPAWPATNSKTGSAYSVAPVLNGIEYPGAALVILGEAGEGPAPSSPSVLINDGDEFTDDPYVHLTLSAEGAAWYRVGLSPETLDLSPWTPMTSETMFGLGQIDGERFVYVQYAGPTGVVSEIVSDGIAFEYRDQDNDGIPDSRDDDRDGDGIPNDEDDFPDDPDEWLDTDGDGIGDNADLDDDGDGMPDDWEIAHGLDPKDPSDAGLDPDGDSLTIVDEYTYGTDPNNADTDGDGLPDGWEVANGTDPLVADANVDPDGDGLTNAQEHTLGTDPNNADTDGDGLPDGWEVANGLDPLDPADAAGDPDGDTLTNAQEYAAGTDPNNADTDGDGLMDGTDPQPANPAPDTAIDSAPSGYIASATATVFFSGTDDSGIARFECRVGEGAWSTCVSPWVIADLADGPVTVAVRSIDDADHFDPTPASAAWTVDLIPPSTTIGDAPAGFTSATTASISYSATDVNGVDGYECRLDGGAWTPCASPWILSSLIEGSHAVEIRATDSAGNVEAPPASAYWTVDTTPPVITIISGPPAVTTSTTATFGFSATDAVGIARIECSLDEGPWGNCVSPFAVTGLSSGPHKLDVRAADLADNVGHPVRASWVIEEEAVGWVTASAGENHVCGIRHDGGLWCWGRSVYGESGRASFASSGSPEEVGTGTDWRDVSAGSNYTCGIQDPGTLWCWGWNGQRQLGIGLSADWITSAAQVGNDSDWMIVRAGWTHTCALKVDQTLWCWGWNNRGQLGIGDTPSGVSAPTRVGDGTDWSQVAVGQSFTCALRTDGGLWCWGAGTLGEIGDGLASDRSVPVQVAVGSVWVGIAAGPHHACAIRADRSLWCWGSGRYGQLGTGLTADQHVPVQVGSWTNWMAVDAGTNGNTTCGTTVTGALWCWGQNSYGQLGDGTFIDSSSPVSAASSMLGWSAPHVGGTFVCALRTSVNLWCWGSNAFGQLGQGVQGNTAVGVPVDDSVDWDFVGGGRHHTCGMKNFEIWCWGDSAFGQIGVAGAIAAESPTRVDFLGPWSGLAVGGDHNCAASLGGEISCWGSNQSGQLGDGTTVGTALPVRVDGFADAATLAAGRSHTCAITNAGALWCWGSNQFGQLGDGTSTNRSSAISVDGGHQWISIALGWYHTCGVDVDGALWCWGQNSQGQLGDGTTSQRRSPVRIGSQSDWAEVTAGGYHTCAAKDDGTAWCWGSGQHGQLGHGDQFGRVEPQQLAGLQRWLLVRAGGYHSCGIDTYFELWCWGRNLEGQLGVGEFSTVESMGVSIPEPLGYEGTWHSIATGSLSTSCALRVTGSLVCWGQNTRGQIGDGTAWEVVPALVPAP